MQLPTRGYRDAIDFGWHKYPSLQRLHDRVFDSVSDRFHNADFGYRALIADNHFQYYVFSPCKLRDFAMQYRRVWREDW